MLGYCFVGDEAGFSNFLGLFQVIMANPCGLSRLQICPLYTTVSETKPPQAVLRDLNTVLVSRVGFDSGPFVGRRRLGQKPLLGEELF